MTKTDVTKTEMAEFLADNDPNVQVRTLMRKTHAELVALVEVATTPEVDEEDDEAQA